MDYVGAQFLVILSEQNFPKAIRCFDQPIFCPSGAPANGPMGSFRVGHMT